MTERERSGIAWPHDLALDLGILVALAGLVLLSCVGCGTPTPTQDRGDAVDTLEPSPTGIPRGGFRAMPTPTATAVPADAALTTLALLRWGEEVTPYTDIIGHASQTMADLFGDPKDGDAAWIALIAAQVVRLRKADAALREIVPPEECREVHAMLLSASGDYLLGGEYALRGVQQQDPYVELQGSKYTLSGAVKMRRVAQMIKAMTP